MGDTETKFIDFIGVERFDLITDSYLVNFVNCMKIKGQEVPVWQEDKKDKVFKVFILLAWKISDFKDELEDEFVSSGGVRCRTESTI